MLIFLGQLILLFSIYILGIRFLGRSALAQITPHDFGAIIYLAYISFGPLKIDTISKALIGIIVVISLHLVIGRLTLVNKINRFIIGEPIILIKHGKLIPSHLKKARYPLIELLAALRSSGYPEIQDIHYAILESNGGVSILPKREVAPITPHDLKVEIPYDEIPISVIVEGRIQEKNLKLLHKDKVWLKTELEKKGYRQLKDIFFATVSDKKHRLNVYLKDTVKEDC
ncbi:DUF421 domain-containing protein [Bacillus sp. V3B]|uniref:DUF421 domain-containing protein n=1 Tax=Bacillus sp. V3B TaxID=2804915 RepID=UPI00210927AC|nr:YetF domain-containing protein [Bacillus sp. V3B]MCQ6274845.1 DUF421 domain-containing protein [Bacillus sp. V3B]